MSIYKFGNCPNWRIRPAARDFMHAFQEFLEDTDCDRMEHTEE